MSEEAKQREHISLLAKSRYDRGLTVTASGNTSARLSDGHLYPARLSLLDAAQCNGLVAKFGGQWDD